MYNDHKDHHFLFDVDGTLTESRQLIDPNFKIFLMTFFIENKCSIVTGSDFSKTEEQLGTALISQCQYVFNCSGNSVYNGPQSDWLPPQSLTDYLHNRLSSSMFKTRTGNHIENRPGSINFSVVGRNATQEQRKEYSVYDSRTSERKKLTADINSTFPDIQAVVGGETGIDIFEKGKDKRQVLQYISEKNVIFFGDKMEKDGNDRPLLDEIRRNKRGITYNVTDWQNTYDILYWNWHAHMPRA